MMSRRCSCTFVDVHIKHYIVLDIRGTERVLSVCNLLMSRRCSCAFVISSLEALYQE